jgi:hypothetical protein
VVVVAMFPSALQSTDLMPYPGALIPHPALTNIRIVQHPKHRLAGRACDKHGRVDGAGAWFPDEVPLGLKMIERLLAVRTSCLHRIVPKLCKLIKSASRCCAVSTSQDVPFLTFGASQDVAFFTFRAHARGNV